VKKKLCFLFLIVIFCITNVKAQTIIKIAFFQPQPFQVSPLVDTLSLAGNTSVILGSNLLLSGGSGQYTYSWMQNNVVLHTLPTFEVSQQGTYQLLVKDGAGCSALIQFVVMLNAGLSDELSDSFEIYPIPARGHVFINSTHIDQLKSIRIYQTDGKQMLYLAEKEPISSGKLKINVEQLPAGTYLMTLELNDQLINRQLILQ
jgi:hypothetical protein